MTQLIVHSVDGIDEVGPDTDLTAVIGDLGGLADGDVVVVTSKVVSKAEGRVVSGDRESAIDDETVRLVARRGATRIVENRLGLVMAAAGVDNSNVAPGLLVLLPLDPDATARRLRVGLHERYAVNVAVLITDTAGRAWRHGQTDLCIGAAGLLALEPFAGRTDPYGNDLLVTEPAVADEIAAATELVSGKLGGRPVTVVRGLAERVLPASEHGPGAAVLIRDRGSDMFGLGAREAVVAALATQPGPLELAAFGAASPPEDLVDALVQCGRPAAIEGAVVVLDEAPAADPVVQALARAHGWTTRTATSLEPLS